MSTYFIAFWNLENLFAPEDYPDREPWLAKKVAADLKGWSSELFQRKIARLQHVIGLMNGAAGPDLLGVCEVENRHCLEILCGALNASLVGRRYESVHFDSTKDRRGIDTAFVYDRNRLSVDPDKIFSHWVMRRTGTRDITQVTFTTNAGNEFVALCNHWPSRSGGPANESAGFRMTAGETLGYWHERIREERGEAIPVIAMGDFNDDPHDPSLTIHAQATRERDDVENADSARFYNLTWNILRQSAVDGSGNARMLYGSLYFQGNGNSFDQLLVSPALLQARSPLRVVEATTRIEAIPEMVARSKNEGPIRFGLPKGNPAKNVNLDGFSDHFPVSVMIEESLSA